MESIKTDLTKVLTISGQQGLYLYIAQARTGAIIENLETKKRSCIDLKSKITALYDISIYTEDSEVRLQQVFEDMHKLLGEDMAPSSKSSNEELKAFFAKVIPNYDADRFYVSHMKKVVDWYNYIKQYATLDFVSHEEQANTAE